MASRPLPPGRRGRGPRVASGLHHLPEPKLLDVSVTHTTTAAITSTTASHATETSVLSSRTAHEPEPTPIVTPPPTPSTAPAAAPTLASLDAASSVDPAIDVPPARAPPPIIPAPIAPAVVAPPPIVADVVQEPAPRHVNHVVTALEPTTAVHQLLHTSYTHEAPVSAPPTPAARREPAIAAPAPAPVSAPASAPAPEPSSIDELGPFDPVALLLPVDAVPDVPESIECLYDDAAVAMQKRVLKVVRKLVGKDKSKLEDFKINSRLFGNSFMEPHEYLESLVQDLGAIRALQFVPSLLTIQADYMKRAGLLLAARNYRMRHFAALETQVAAMRAAAVAPAAASPEPVPAPVPEVLSTQSAHVPVLATATAVTAAVVATTEEETERMENHVASLSSPVAPAASPLTLEEPQGNDAVDDEATEPADAADVVAAATDEVLDAVISAPEEADASVSSETAVAALIGAVAPLTEQPKTVELHATAGLAADDDSHASDTAAAVAEVEAAQVPSPQVKASPVVESDVTPREPLSVSAPTLSEPAPPVQTVSVHHEVAEPVFSISDLPLAFQQAFASPEPSPKHRQAPAAAPTAVAAPTKRLETESSSSFAEAENLFGERFSTGSTSSDNAETLFGESIYHSTAASPVARDAIPKPVHSQLLFGFATAGADSDSDSDDSGFSSS